MRALPVTPLTTYQQPRRWRLAPPTPAYPRTAVPPRHAERSSRRSCFAPLVQAAMRRAHLATQLDCSPPVALRQAGPVTAMETMSALDLVDQPLQDQQSDPHAEIPRWGRRRRPARSRPGVPRPPRSAATGCPPGSQRGLHGSPQASSPVVRGHRGDMPAWQGRQDLSRSRWRWAGAAPSRSPSCTPPAPSAGYGAAMPLPRSHHRPSTGDRAQLSS
mmetsp:Transcript_49089/g.106744  ORF Transcript_49089/g.106744 Transcript_49089/m.106744 type:complete len:217 (-) Transcript_49089:1615-2265(-)